MAQTREQSDNGPRVVHPRATGSTVYLVAFLALMTAFFLFAEFSHLHPIMKLFYWLALVF
ncbi:MAG TPA: hypothetical protein VFA95_01040 [Gammaproteobacteria bacterium]|nr:hypothetical protein [Gammaproteobacteria bacterium]